MDGSNDRQRKDRLIQTRVPQNLESTLKDEARKRRLSVSHLIRNVLEDTFHLVDNVVNEVDRVVSDSVGMAQTLRRDAQRLAATARGHTSHRREPAEHERDDLDDERHDEDHADQPVSERPGSAEAGSSESPSQPGGESDAPPPMPSRAVDDELAEAMLAIEAALSEPPPPNDADNVGSLLPAALPGDAALFGVYALQESVVYRAAACARCHASLARGTRAYLGISDVSAMAGPTWLCAECTDALADDGAL